MQLQYIAYAANILHAAEQSGSFPFAVVIDGRPAGFETNNTSAMFAIGKESLSGACFSPDWSLDNGIMVIVFISC